MSFWSSVFPSASTGSANQQHQQQIQWQQALANLQQQAQYQQQIRNLLFVASKQWEHVPPRYPSCIALPEGV